MTTYYVDDGGDNSDGTTWAKAYTSVSALDDAVALAAGDIIYVGHDHVCQYTHAADRAITGPTSGVPCILMSVTQGSSPVTYQKSATNQIATTEGAYSLTFNGSWAIYGIRMTAGASIVISNAGPEKNITLEDVTLAPGANYGCVLNPIVSPQWARNLTIDLTADGTTPSSSYVIRVNDRAVVQIQGLSFVNAGYRTGTVIGDYYNGGILLSGADFSGFTNGTTCEIAQVETFWNDNVFSHCLTAATWTAFRGYNERNGSCSMYNVGSANSPTSLLMRSSYGDLISSTAIVRTGGATVETVATSWLITTTANAVEGAPFYCPWVYGTIGSTGSKTFDIYTTNDTADFTDAEVWLEVEYSATSNSPQWTVLSDHRVFTTTASAQTDDTTSTWTGTGPSFTYKQKLSVTATVSQTGQYRARVVVGKASIASSRYFYIDPMITVT